MKREIFAVLLSLSGTLAAVEFDRFEDLKEPVLFPRNGEIKVDRYGNYTLNGRPRFLLGAQIPNKIVGSMAPTAGYTADLKWLYEEVINYQNAQRVGFDTLSYFSSEGWVKEYKKDYTSFLFDEETMQALDKVRRECGLPLQVDYTCAPWSHGVFLSMQRKKEINWPESVFNTGGEMSDSNHWVPYSINDPAGRELYLKMWRFGALELKKSGGKALMYELFNEPAYHDPSPVNRQAFKVFLQNRYQSVAALNTLWGKNYASFDAAVAFDNRTDSPGLYVDWSKFMEKSFLSLCEDGMKTIREIDPDARFCVQLGGADGYRTISKNHVNYWAIAQAMQTVSTPTGGGTFIEQGGATAPTAQAIDNQFPSSTTRENLLMRRFIRSVAAGKPIHDGETYSGRDYPALHAILWQQLVRGGNANYLFLWCKRAWDERWKPAGSEEGGRRLAELMPFHILNPWAFPTDGIKAVMDVKKEILTVDDIFVPRQNYAAPQVGLLFSYASERYAPSVGERRQNEIRNFDAALEFLHYPFGVVFEEQLQPDFLQNYKLVFAAGTSNLAPGSREKLIAYVKSGGTLVAALAPMQLDEYGKKLPTADWFDFELAAAAEKSGVLSGKLAESARLPGPVKARQNLALQQMSADWEVVAALDGTPAVVRKKLGKGYLYFIASQQADYHLAALVDRIAAACQARPLASLTMDQSPGLLPNIEMHRFDLGELHGYYLFNFDNYPKLGVLTAGDDTLIDPLTKQSYPGGRILLEAKTVKILVSGPAAAVRKRFGSVAPVTAEQLAARYAESAQKATRSAVKTPAQTLYQPDMKYTRTLDLRPWCNRGFMDSVAGDGQGGWTDQGADNSLDSVPWGPQILCGVPAELLRYDEVENKTCLVLASKHLRPGFGAEKAENIPVNQLVKKLYFFHTAAWSAAGTKALDYRIRYADGLTVTVPVVSGRDIGDWWIDRGDNALLRKQVAFKNSLNRGFYIMSWSNPYPEREVKSLDIVSANGDVIPVVVAITVEGLDPATSTVDYPLTDLAGRGWLGCSPKWDNGVLKTVFGPEVKDWCGVEIALPTDLTIELDRAGIEQSSLRFDVNALADAWGKTAGGQSFQLYFTLAGGKEKTSAKVQLGSFLEGRVIDADAATTQAVNIPLKLFFPNGVSDRIAGLALQYTGIAPEAGVALSDLRLELPAKALKMPKVKITASAPDWKTQAINEVALTGTAQNLHVALQPGGGSWAGVQFNAPVGGEYQIAADKAADTFLVFELGAAAGLPLQVGLVDQNNQSSMRRYLEDYGKRPAAVDDLVSLAIPVKDFKSAGDTVKAVVFQIRGKADAGAFTLRNLRFELRQKE